MWDILPESSGFSGGLFTSYLTEKSARRVPGYRTLEQRASEWTAAVSCLELPSALLHEVASFVPLAGARLMVTCRGGLPELFRFERWLRSLAQHNYLKEGAELQMRNIYGRRMPALETHESIFSALKRCKCRHTCLVPLLTPITLSIPSRAAPTEICFLLYCKC